jgi:hypothetical protein
LAVKELFLIPMVAIGITGKEHGQWGLPVEIKKNSLVAIRRTGKGYGGWQ